MPIKSRQFEQLLADRGRKTGSEVDQIMRRLRKAGKIEAGPRGVHAPDVDAKHAARVLLAVCGTIIPREADMTWAAYSGSRSADDGRPLFAALADVLESGASNVASVRIWVDSCMAEIARADGSVEVFKRPNDQPPGAAFDTEARQVTIIGGGLIRQIAEALK